MSFHGLENVMYSPFSEIPAIHKLELKYQFRLDPCGMDLILAIVGAGTIDDLRTAIEHGYPLSPEDTGPMIYRWGTFGRPLHDTRMAYHEAAAMGKFEMFRYLSQTGIPIDLPDRDGKTVAHYACSLRYQCSIEGKIAVLEYLKDKLPLSSLDPEISPPLFEITKTSFDRMGCFKSRLEINPFDPKQSESIQRIIETMIRLDPLAGIQPNPKDRSLIDYFIDRWPRHYQSPTFRSKIEPIINLLRVLGITDSIYFDFETGTPIGSKLSRTIFVYPDSEEDEIEFDSSIQYASMLEFLQTPISAQEQQEIRERVYFSQSLVSILISFL